MRHPDSAVNVILFATRNNGKIATMRPKLLSYLVASSLAVMAQIAFVGAQPKEPTVSEKDLAAKVKCEDFLKNRDGSWTSGPNAMIGNSIFSNNTFGIHGIAFDGADLAVVLERKCGGH